LTIKSAQHTKNSPQFSVYSSLSRPMQLAPSVDYQLSTASSQIRLSIPARIQPERSAAASLQPPVLSSQLIPLWPRTDN